MKGRTYKLNDSNKNIIQRFIRSEFYLLVDITQMYKKIKKFNLLIHGFLLNFTFSHRYFVNLLCAWR